MTAEIKRRIPLSVRHRARHAIEFARSRPSHYASGAVVPRGRAGGAYQRWYRTRRLRRFFAPLLAPGALAFDVGANVGVWTEGLRAAGCRVVAVEPQEECAGVISRRHADDREVTVVTAAVGAEAGETELFVAAIDEQATTSRAWIEAMVGRGGADPSFWSGTRLVPVRTLDDLIAEFGRPAYVKLDVEGSEPDALAGLGQPVPLLSFETHGQTPEDAHACLARLAELGEYEFNLTPGEFPSLEWPEWRDATAVRAALETMPHGWNNVFARLRSAR